MANTRVLWRNEALPIQHFIFSVALPQIEHAAEGLERWGYATVEPFYSFNQEGLINRAQLEVTFYDKTSSHEPKYRVDKQIYPPVKAAEAAKVVRESLGQKYKLLEPKEVLDFRRSPAPVGDVFLWKPDDAS